MYKSNNLLKYIIIVYKNIMIFFIETSRKRDVVINIDINYRIDYTE